MKRLEKAKTWYDAQLSRLKHIQELSDKHDQQPHLRGLLGDLVRLKKGGERNAKFKEEREDLNRVALVGLFAAFEADFKESFIDYIAKRSRMSNEQVENTLPDTISTWLAMYRILEPQNFAEPSWKEIIRIRDERNRLAHEGFHQPIAPTSPEKVYEALMKPLQNLAAKVQN